MISFDKNVKDRLIEHFDSQYLIVFFYFELGLYDKNWFSIFLIHRFCDTLKMHECMFYQTTRFCYGQCYYTQVSLTTERDRSFLEFIGS
jgi:hypothetical protein